MGYNIVMKQAILIHGFQKIDEYNNPNQPSPSNSNWFPWLQNMLNIHGVLTQTPEMPTPYKPQYDEWEQHFSRNIIDSNTMLIGHSMGSGFIIRWLSEHPAVKLDKVVLVAPWLDIEGRLNNDFFDFTIRQDIAKQCKSLVIICSDNDMKRINNTVKICKKQIDDIQMISMPNMGHFLTKHMGAESFIELFDLLMA